MVLVNHLTHEPAIKEIEKEEQVIELINEVGKDILNYLNKCNLGSLKDILKIVEQGKYESERNRKPSEPTVTNRINLSQAQSLIQDYRRKSEGGCQSCKDLEKHYENNETYRYCKAKEDKDSVMNLLDSETSPKIKEFYEKGCEDRKPIFSKTIEQILEEAN